MVYAHLSQDERYQIQHLHGGGFSTRQIGVELRRAGTTISRELRRNQDGASKYQARVAQRKNTKRRHAASAQARVGLDQWVAMEARLIAEQWSPVQIASELFISHERIYQHIAADRQRGGTLWRHLRCRKQRRRHRCAPGNGNASMGDASPSGRSGWTVVSGWVTGKATRSWVRGSRGS
jgi:IS30 family transposase